MWLVPEKVHHLLGKLFGPLHLFWGPLCVGKTIKASKRIYRPVTELPTKRHRASFLTSLGNGDDGVCVLQGDGYRCIRYFRQQVHQVTHAIFNHTPVSRETPERGSITSQNWPDTTFPSCPNQPHQRQLMLKAEPHFHLTHIKYNSLFRRSCQ